MTSRYLYKLRPARPDMLRLGPTDSEAAIVEDHTSYLEELAEQGVVRFIGRTLTTDETSFGIVVLEADSEATARAIMNRDPGVAEGVMQAELYPFKVVYMGDG